MKRKLIEQGGGGLVAYIPKQWCDANSLKAGDDVTFTKEDDGTLRVAAEPTEERKEIRLAFDDEERLFIWIMINHLYRAGYDRISVRYSNDEQLEHVREVVDQYLLGFEVVDETDEKVVLENIAGPGEDKQDVLMRRIFMLIDELFDMLHEEMERSQFDRYDKVLEIRKKIGQYDNFCRRNISKKRFYQEGAGFSWMLYIQLYLVSHNLIHLYEALKDADGEIGESVPELLEELHGYYTEMYEGFFRQDLERLKKVNGPLDRAYYTIQEEYLASSNGVDSVAQYYLAELARLLYKTSSYPLLGVMLSAENERTTEL